MISILKTTYFVIFAFLIFYESQELAAQTFTTCDLGVDYNYYVDAEGGGESFALNNIPHNLNNVRVYVTNGFLFNTDEIFIQNVTFTFSSTGSMALYFDAHFDSCCFVGDNSYWDGVRISNLYAPQLSIDFSSCYFEKGGGSAITSAVYQGSPGELKLTMTQCEFLDCPRAVSIKNLLFNQCRFYDCIFNIENEQLTGPRAIYADRSLFIMYNCTINNYTTAVRLLNSSNSTILSSSITDCDKGITLESNSTCFAKINNINLRGGSSIGITSADSYINGSSNIIKNCRTGISISGTRGRTAANAFNLWDNQIGSITSNEYGSVGIYINNFGNTIPGFTKIHNGNEIGFYNQNVANHCGIFVNNVFANNSIEIQDNDIVGTHNGIFINNTGSTLITNNYIDSKPISATNFLYPSWSGIRLQNCTNTFLKGNQMTSDNLYANGIDVTAGSNNKFCCNDIIQAPQGVTFDETSSAELKGTSMDYAQNYEGVYLSGSAIIGSQRLSNNKWIQNGNNGARCENSPNYDMSIFTVPSNNEPYHPININIPDWFRITSTDSVFDCPEYGGSNCDIIWTPKKLNRFTNLDSFVINDDFEDTFGLDQANWIRLALIDNYLMDSTIFQDNSTMSNYVYSLFDSDLYKAAAIKNQLHVLLHENTKWQNYTEDAVKYLSYSDSLSTLAHENPGNISNIYSVTAFDSLILLKDLADSSLILAQEYFEDHLGDFQSMLDTFSPATLWGEKMKQYYLILSSIVERDSLYLEEEEADTLSQLAALCTLSFGELPYNASSLLQLFGVTVIPGQENCYPPVEPIYAHKNALNALRGDERAPTLVDFYKKMVEIYGINGSLLFKGQLHENELLNISKSYKGILIIRDVASNQLIRLFISNN